MTHKFNYRQFIYNLPLPLDVIRIIKEYIGKISKPKLINNYDDYKVMFRNRHRKRAFTI